MKKIKTIKEKIESNIIFKILKIIGYILAVMLVIVILVQKVTNNNLSIGGIRIFMVVSESMVPEYGIGDILISKETDVDNINIGDNVTYRGEQEQLAGLIITHEVVKKEEREGTVYFVTKGIANSIEDPEIRYDQIYGKVIYKTVILSFIGKMMNNIVVFYLVFVLIGVIISIEIVSSIFDKEDDADG